MILADTSVWIGHFRQNDERLAGLLDATGLLIHPFVIGELAVGNLRQREATIDYLSSLPPATLATDREVLQFIEANALFGLGLGYVDAQLLASVRLTPGATLWSGDKRLADVADRMGLVAAR